ncbi:integrin alpha-L [Chanos chanos]|uniref:Integrin alpha-L n=1 Tax=Chanos chanos TaxID=29144 RepID=A0A6J2VYK3_CHACN|nr:integrin alpha-L-like [Chanos chanos]
MEEKRSHLCFFLYLSYLVLTGWSFNIDVAETNTFTSGKQDDFFGYSARQYPSERGNRILVSAPLHNNGLGTVYSCQHPGKQCNVVYSQVNDSIKSFGISMAINPRPPAAFTSCSPAVVHECQGYSYLNGECYSFTQLEQQSTTKAAYQECTKKNVNLIFLFDGSRSMTTAEFNKNKEFIISIMNSFSNSSIQFAAVQFSTTYRKVFDFRDYQEKTAVEKLMKEKHFNELTNTYKAIKYTLDDLFDNLKAGADPEAQKALVIITDGNPSDPDPRGAIIRRCKENNILRFIIGVGKVEMDKLRRMASEPEHNNTFHISDYGGLNGLLGNLQNKIYNIEAQGGHSEKRRKELSQSGFSVVYQEDSLILGAVGMNDWQGGLFEILGSGNEEIELKDPRLHQDSYMGYSVAVGRKSGHALLFSGAPRSNHTGEMVVFKKTHSNWTVIDNLMGEQIGSYFGADLCSIDIDSDGTTDFLIVGAPLYHQSQPQREGKIYVYSLHNSLSLVKVQEVMESVRGRFGWVLASVRDLNGDALRDVVVSAPLEDQSRGVVYIYLGDKAKGIRSKYSQRITGEEISNGLQQFGVALDGQMDMNGDNLTDILVGARGKAVLLRSMPVINVSAQLSFTPAAISTQAIDCLGLEKRMFIAVTLTACFHMAESTMSTQGAAVTGLNVSYLLHLDAVRPRSRVYLDEDGKIQNETFNVNLMDSTSCFNHSVYMPNCVEDTLSALRMKLNFSQMESKRVNAVLNTDSVTVTYVEVPFEKSCQRNESCVADLKLDFEFINKTLVVLDQSSFLVNLELSNVGDDSYNTTVVLYYPHGLSLSKFEAIEANRRTLSRCGEQEGVVDRTTCSISSPVYRSQTRAKFQSLFRISSDYDWSDTMEMIITANSDNMINSTGATLSKSLPVQYAIDLDFMLDYDQSDTYINCTLEDRGPKLVKSIYEVRNNGYKAFPVQVHFTVQTKSGKHVEIRDHSVSVSENITQCKVVEPTRVGRACGEMENCMFIECDEFVLQSSPIRFVLSQSVTLHSTEEYEGGLQFFEKSIDMQFASSADLSYNRTRYREMTTDRPGKEESAKSHSVKTPVKVELIFPPNKLLIVMCGASGGLLLLMILIVIFYKCGFFKRKGPYCDLEEQSGVPVSQTEDPPAQKEKVSLSQDDEVEDKLLPKGDAVEDTLLHQENGVNDGPLH